MEDFVYIILVIAWLVFSLIKKKPKSDSPARPKPASRPETTSQPKEFDIEEMFQEFFGTSKKEQPQPQPAREPTAIERSFEKQETEYSSFDDDYRNYQDPVFEEHTGLDAVDNEYQFSAEVRNQTIDELIRANAAEEARLQAAEEMMEGASGKDSLANFNARDAVIFSEILNRKYS